MQREVVPTAVWTRRRSLLKRLPVTRVAEGVTGRLGGGVIIAVQHIGVVGVGTRVVLGWEPRRNSGQGGARRRRGGRRPGREGHAPSRRRVECGCPSLRRHGGDGDGHGSRTTLLETAHRQRTPTAARRQQPRHGRAWGHQASRVLVVPVLHQQEGMCSGEIKNDGGGAFKLALTNDENNGYSLPRRVVDATKGPLGGPTNPHHGEGHVAEINWCIARGTDDYVAPARALCKTFRIGRPGARLRVNPNSDWRGFRRGARKRGCPQHSEACSKSHRDDPPTPERKATSCGYKAQIRLNVLLASFTTRGIFVAHRPVLQVELRLLR